MGKLIKKVKGYLDLGRLVEHLKKTKTLKKPDDKKEVK